MTQINQGESNVVTTEKVGLLAIKTDQQSPKLVNPSKTAFTGEALLVQLGIEQALASPLGCFTVAFVFSDVRDHAMIEADFAPVAGVEGTISVENRPSNDQTLTFHRLEGGLKLSFQTKCVVMIVGDDRGRSDHIALGLGDRQDVTGFRPLARLVSHTFAAFLGNRMAAIEVQLG